MTEQTLPEALRLTTDEDGGLSAVLTGGFSNAPSGRPPEAGRPFGGLVAAQAATAMRQALGITAPLRTLSVQYLTAAKFGLPVQFRPRLLRGGRSVAFATVEAGQGSRTTLNASASYGVDSHDFPLDSALAVRPPALDSLDPDRRLTGDMAPHFTRHVDYRFESGPHILGGNTGRPAVERLWMRTNDGAPLDEARLCYLLDALYPPAWTILTNPPGGASVDLRFDILNDPTPDNAPDGWAFFDFRMLDLGRGWTVDDVTVWGADGVPLALARQRRKLL